MEIGTFIFDKLEYFVVVIGIGGTILFLKTKRYKTASNDLTQKLIKLHKKKEMFNKRVKSLL